MDTAHCYQLSDPTQNRQFHRRWREPSPPPASPPTPASTDAEPGAATLQGWVDEWRQRRSKEVPRSAEPRA